MKTLNTIKLSTAAIALAFSTATLAVTEPKAPTNNDWQSSLAQEFSKLDNSGNGLVLPNEASRGKAFNKKTFATADKDNDGTIDQNEYIQYKTDMGATNQPSNNVSMSADSPSAMAAENMSSEETANRDAAEMRSDDQMMADNSQPEKRAVGVVIDDSVITTKAKAAIFNTPDLKTLQISVETRKGEVMLSGSVDNEAAKMKAEEVVKNVGGVISVTNNLEVKT